MRDILPIPEKPLEGYERFMTVAPGVKLYRFAGEKRVELIACRKGVNGQPNTIFKIYVDKKERFASVWRDCQCLFEIRGMNVGRAYVEKMAISALHRYFKDQRPSGSKRRAKKRLVTKMRLAASEARHE